VGSVVARVDARDRRRRSTSSSPPRPWTRASRAGRVGT
jgi:hypothetical protein